MREGALELAGVILLKRRVVQVAVVSLHTQISPRLPLEYQCLTSSGEELKHEYVFAHFLLLSFV